MNEAEPSVFFTRKERAELERETEKAASAGDPCGPAGFKPVGRVHYTKSKYDSPPEKRRKAGGKEVL